MCFLAKARIVGPGKTAPSTSKTGQQPSASLYHLAPMMIAEWPDVRDLSSPSCSLSLLRRFSSEGQICVEQTCGVKTCQGAAFLSPWANLMYQRFSCRHRAPVDVNTSACIPCCSKEAIFLQAVSADFLTFNGGGQHSLSLVIRSLRRNTASRNVARPNISRARTRLLFKRTRRLKTGKADFFFPVFLGVSASNNKGCVAWVCNPDLFAGAAGMCAGLEAKHRADERVFCSQLLCAESALTRNLAMLVI